MPKSRPPYPPEFRQRIIELVRRGRTAESLAEQFEPTAQTIRNWLADRDAGQRPDGLTTDEREELRRLRRENKTLRGEREILKKAGRWVQPVGATQAAWFAKETRCPCSRGRFSRGRSLPLPPPQATVGPAPSYRMMSR